MNGIHDLGGMHGFGPVVPEKDEPVVVKKGFGGFHHTALDTILRNHGVTTCVVCGVTTCVCVSTTVRGGLEYNYRMMIVGDAVAEVSRETHAAELKTMQRVFGEVKTTAEIEGAHFTIVWTWRSGNIRVISMRRAHEQEIRKHREAHRR